MAKNFFHSGNERLAEAAVAWAKERGLRGDSLSDFDGDGPRWGSG